MEKKLVAPMLAPLLALLVAGPGYGAVQWAEAVSVQRLNVPDLVVIDRLNQQHQLLHQTRPHGVNSDNSGQPEAASLINGTVSHDLSSDSEHQTQVLFECLISYDKRRDKNLVIKWRHEDQSEPIYQWIPGLNKRSIAPQYRAYIAPIIADNPLSGPVSTNHQNNSSASTSDQIQFLEAGFRLVRPTKELGGKYTCLAVSSQNDDSKWKKMIVYTPPRIFRFNASRTDIRALLASQRDRLIQPSMIGPATSGAASAVPFHPQLPLANRMRGFENQQNPIPATIPPSMYSTIDYVNVNQQRSRQQLPGSHQVLLGPGNRLMTGASASATGSVPTFPALDTANTALAQRASPQTSLDLLSRASLPGATIRANRLAFGQNGVKLVCDIDQVFPVPEVSIYRLAKLDGLHPDKLAKLDTQIERDSLTGLYHVQVTSIVEDEELQMKYGSQEPVYFECLIALTNLELSKYADNKRSIVYRPGMLTSGASQIVSEDVNQEQTASKAGLSIMDMGDRQTTFVRFLLAALMSSWMWFIYFPRLVR